MSLLEARSRAHELIRSDHEKVIKLLMLRVAQVKYVMNRTPLFSHENVSSLRSKIEPPSPGSGDALIQYALTMHELFVSSYKSLFEHAPDANENNSWLRELEETLLEMRRIVMQNLSKHPALRPYNLLTKLSEHVEKYEELGSEYTLLQTEKNRLLRESIFLNNEAEEHCSRTGYDTLTRLNSSFDKLVMEKRALNEHWMNHWNSLSVIFKCLAENEKASASWENAQHRMMHLYLTNPALTREKDAHGQGLVMILRLAVSALELDENVFVGLNKEDVHATILRALEDPLFVHYIEHVHALDVAIAANQNERDNHPLHRALMDVGQRENSIVLSQEKVEEAIFNTIQLRENVAKEIQSVWKEANQVCQSQLNFELEKII